MRDQDIPKIMKYVKENMDEVKQIIAFLESECDLNKEPEEETVVKEDEKSGTDKTSDGVVYPDVGDGTGVEGSPLHEEEENEEVTEEDEIDGKKVEEAGTASVGVATGAAQPVSGPAGTANDGVARVKSRLGAIQKRYDESVPLNGSANDVKAMMESWKNVPKYSPNQGGF